ncbi:F-box domain, Skp2-like protein [Fusarium austroafricanum]|uniref:F-box domain, Skp2-like protein n=1 Tax=Fusarium austroafricanum TaxID=2364996 RepID=A0A8H4NWP3_9HYPO|nr:F-box domain, Skp2-like protein [Fusarium austroafricanum]
MEENTPLTPPGVDQPSIVDVCSYRRRDYEETLIQYEPEEMQIVHESLQNPFDTPPLSNLGVLDSLPIELLNEVLRDLDILSYTRFRHVNRRARILGSELREYKLVIKHGLEGFLSALQLVTAKDETATSKKFSDKPIDIIIDVDRDGTGKK